MVAVGHAIVDVLANAGDGVLDRLGLRKATMTLVDSARAEQVEAALTPVAVASGGSAANTAAGLASLGTRAGFVGRVADDRLGRLFAADIAAAGVSFEVPRATAGPPTGRSVVLVTPDAEKTMCTDLGAGALLGAGDIDAGAIAAARIVYVEGYLCGGDHTSAALAAVVDAAAAGSTTVALSLSDPAWVQLQRVALDAMLDHAGMVFANEEEACLLSGAASAEAAVERLRARCPTVVVTCGAEGSLVAVGDQRVRVPAEQAASAVDTTGAGDLYAAGFLHGVLRGAQPSECARLGSLCAAEVVGHMGARPLVSLASLAEAAGVGN